MSRVNGAPGAMFKMVWHRSVIQNWSVARVKCHSPTFIAAAVNVTRSSLSASDFSALRRRRFCASP